MNNLDSLWLFLIIPFNTFIRSIFYLIICFWDQRNINQCFPWSHLHKFMAMLATCGFNFPLCPSGPIHSSILNFALPEIKFQSLEAENVPLAEVTLDAKILVKRLLNLLLCLLSLQFQCHLFVFFSFDLYSFIAVCQMLVFWSLLIFFY